MPALLGQAELQGYSRGDPTTRLLPSPTPALRHFGASRSPQYHHRASAPGLNGPCLCWEPALPACLLSVGSQSTAKIHVGKNPCLGCSPNPTDPPGGGGPRGASAGRISESPPAPGCQTPTCPQQEAPSAKDFCRRRRHSLHLPPRPGASCLREPFTAC